MIACGAVAVLAACALYSTLLALAYRDRCRRLEDEVRRLGGDPNAIDD